MERAAPFQPPVHSPARFNTHTSFNPSSSTVVSRAFIAEAARVQFGRQLSIWHHKWNMIFQMWADSYIQFFKKITFTLCSRLIFFLDLNYTFINAPYKPISFVCFGPFQMSMIKVRPDSVTDSYPNDRLIPLLPVLELLKGSRASF